MKLCIKVSNIKLQNTLTLVLHLLKQTPMKSNFISAISGETFPASQHVDPISIPKHITDLILNEYPEFDPTQPISLSELNHYRELYITATLQKQVGELNQLEKTEIETLGKGRQLTQKQLQ